MSARELDAAGIRAPKLRESYERCRQLNAAHGKTYYLATLLLPPDRRPYVHALYGFARYADEIVDDLGSTLTDAEKAAWLESWGKRFLEDLEAGWSDDPVCMAVVDTVRTWSIPRGYFEAFLHSMAMDLTVTQYQTFDQLHEYVYGSAAVIGLQMLPLLEPTGPEAYDHAQQLGIAFQLANFIRDVSEDLSRGRVYLPLDELAHFDVSRADLERRHITPAIRAAIAWQVDRVKALQQEADPGIAMLAPWAQPCIQAASTLYCGIVDEVARADYDIFAARASVPMRRRLSVAVPAWRKARKARRR